MTVTSKLYRLFVTDRKLRGLRSRLEQAERFLKSQQDQLGQIEARRTAVEAQHRQLRASSANDETEAASIDGHIAELRERMNSAQTNKEYKALLTEVNTFKEKKATIDERMLGYLEKIETMETQLAELVSAKGEREQVCAVAAQDRQARSDEIADQVAELEAERETLAADVPADVLSEYDRLLEERGDEAMAALQIADAKRHEFTCESCMMSLPVELMSALLSHGGLTRCVSCGCILFIEEATRERMAPTAKR